LPSWNQFEDLLITNQCVVICNLRNFSYPKSPSWQVLTGSQEEIGQNLAAIVSETGVKRIDDFGGVCKTFLCDGDIYLDAPRRTKVGAAVFSFTPKNRIAAESQEMAKSANAGGYELLILTSQKDGKFGKVWVLKGIIRHLANERLVYYEDTNSIVDELKDSPEGNAVIVVHVQAPGYEDQTSSFADRIISQGEYQKEVLESVI
jgi:hypothetical protein